MKEMSHVMEFQFQDLSKLKDSKHSTNHHTYGPTIGTHR